MFTKNLENVLQVVLKGPIDYCHEIINKAIGIWIKNTKFRHLFSHPEWYLCGVVGSEKKNKNLLWLCIK